MKILYTGMTPNQTNSIKRAPIETSNYPSAIVKGLIELGGNQVEWRPPTFADRASDYDLIIVNPSACNSFIGRYGALQSFTLLADAYERRVPTIIYFDDWQVHNVFSNARVLAKSPARISRPEPGGSKRPYFFTTTYEDIKKNEARILEGIQRLLTPYDRFATLISAHPWGDKARAARVLRVVDASRLTYLDATPMLDCYAYRAKQPKKKERAWMLAALVPHDIWLKRQGFGWPVQLFGCKKLGAPRLPREQDVADEVAKHWGVLAPEYPQSGSGWFRSRFLYSAWGKSVMYCGRSDAEVLGAPFTEARRLSDVEKYKDKRLAELAYAQAEIVERAAWTRPQFLDGLERMIQLAYRCAGTPLTEEDVGKLGSQTTAGVRSSPGATSRVVASSAPVEIDPRTEQVPDVGIVAGEQKSLF